MKTCWSSRIMICLLISSAAPVVFAAGSAPKPTICSRSCWGAQSPRSTSYMSAITKAVIHHTAGNEFSTTGYEDSKANVRAIQNYHRNTLGWADIGYHFLVDKFGYIFEGRYGSMSSMVLGSHTSGNNTNTFGFNGMGYFHTPKNNVPTAAMMDSLADVIAWRMPSGFSANSSTTPGHYALSASACPGSFMIDKLPSLRTAINANINGGATTYYDYTPTVSANWIESSYAPDRLGSVYYYRGVAPVSDAAVFEINTSGTGSYDIYSWWPAGTNRSNAAPYILPDNTTVYVNQQINGGQWNKIGTNQFNANGLHYVKVSCWTSAGDFVMADAVKLVGPN